MKYSKKSHSVIKIFCVLSLCFLFQLNLNANDSSLIVVVNSDVPIDSITASELKRVFLGRKSIWSDGSQVNCYMLDLNNKTINDIMKKITKMSSSEFNKYWIKKVFSGSGAPPTRVKKITNIIEKVSSNEGAIAILPSSFIEQVKNCKVIKLK